MVTKTDIETYRTAFMANADYDASISRTSLVHMTLWSIFFAMAVVGGLMS